MIHIFPTAMSAEPAATTLTDLAQVLAGYDMQQTGGAA